MQAQLLWSAGPRRAHLPPASTITTANNDINQADHVSHHYSQLSRKLRLFPLTHHLRESKELSRTEENETDVFLNTYYVLTAVDNSAG